MKLILTHHSALEFYRHTKLKPAGMRTFDTESNSDEPYSYESALHQLDRCGCGYLSLPVHLLATRPSERHRSSYVSWHTHQGTLPKGSILHIADNVAVESPELCLTRLATSLSRAKLIRTAFELCGTYALRPDLEEGFAKRPWACTSVNSLRTYINSCGTMPGKAEVTRTLAYLSEGSASPMETITSMLFFLPNRMGGQAIPGGKLNYVVPANDYVHSLTGKSFLKCDILWPESRLCVEYDSDQRHTGSDRITQDASRRAALSYLGFEVISITRQHVLNIATFNDIALLLAKRLGKRRRGFGNQLDKQRELRAEIIEFSNSHKHHSATIAESLISK